MSNIPDNVVESALKIKYQDKEPSFTQSVLWAKKEEEGYSFRVFNDGEWQSVDKSEGGGYMIDEDHKLDADLVDDSSSTNKFTNATEKQTWNGKQEALVSGTNIKTINNESLLGSGNINVAAELPSNLAYTSNDNGEGIIPSDGIRAVTVTSAAAMTINPDVVTVIDGAVGTAAITLQVPNDNLAHVWDILLTTDSSVAITFAMSNSATILYPNGFSVGASKAVEVSVIGVGTKYYLRYGEFA